MIEEVYSNGSLYSREEYAYDENGNKTLEKSIKRDGSIEEWKEYEYDKAGNQIAELSLNNSGEVTGRVDRTYNEQNQLICEEHQPIIGYDGYTRINTFEYDRHGNLVKEVHKLKSGSIAEYYEYEYIKAPQREDLEETPAPVSTEQLQ